MIEDPNQSSTETIADEAVEHGHLVRTASIDRKMLELLVCPVTKGNLRYDAEHNELISRLAKLAYPVRDGVPIMLASEARHIESD